ncbi:MAG: 50S ribosomal protein L10 [Candidatus Pacearchaeota archaeon]
MRSKELKIKKVKEITNLFKEKNFLIISNIEKINANKFKEIKRKLKDDCIIKVIKKSILLKVLENINLEKKQIEEIEKEINKPFCIIITNIDIFRIASILEENKFFTYLKAGEILKEDFVIKKGPTHLLPMEMAELNKAGLQVGVEKGKVVIKQDFILKKNEILTQEMANILQKLDIKPLKIGLNVDIGIDIKNKKIYKNIIIDKEKEREKLIKGINFGLNLALGINYISRYTINSLIQKALIYANQLNKFIEKK